MKNIIYILLIFLSFSAFSQTKTEKKELYKESKKAFDSEEYNNALDLLLEYDSLYPDNYEVIYRIGACYLNSSFDKKKAIPYLEKVIHQNHKDLPAITFKDLGHLYHLDYQLDKSSNMYQEYLSRKPKSKAEVQHLLSTIENAKALIKDSLGLSITNIGNIVNTKQSEVVPYVSADESLLYYQNKETKNFFQATNINGEWAKKNKITISNIEQYQIIKFAGISPDGSQLFIQLGDTSNTDIYYGQNFRKSCDTIFPFNRHINSPYKESSISIAPDENSLYFSSNRPGGFGGYDIYKCLKDEQGQWGEAINLGATVNTKYDELYPFIHPNLTNLFFSSNGHNTMGGFDIFESVFTDNDWGTVKNIGYPINTTYDDISYSLTAKGNIAYFSSTRNDNTSHFDIYSVHLKESIPLTLVKGKILAGDPPEPIKATIQVIDKETKEKLKYIYNPNPKTGHYLLIFPPGKDYDMIVKADGYNPYVINIYIPNQTYFYENFQEILLSPIKINSLGETIGEEIKIKNTFYDIYNNSPNHPVKKYDKLLRLIEELIVNTDTLGLNKVHELATSVEETSSDIKNTEPVKDYDKLFSLIEEAIETSDSLGLKALDEKAIPNISYQNRYFYGRDSANIKLNPVIIGSDTIYAIQIPGQEEEKIVKNESINPSSIKDITNYTVYFEKNQSNIDNKYTIRLNELTELASNNPNLYIEIIGLANTEENSQLAISRAIEVRTFFTNNNLTINKTKTIARLNKLESNEKGQRVDIRLFESKQQLYKEGKFSSAVKLENTDNKQALADDIVYKIQIASGSNYLLDDNKFFKGETIKHYLHNKLHKYTIGEFTTIGSAKEELMRIRKEGFSDAFIVKFKNGVRID